MSETKQTIEIAIPDKESRALKLKANYAQGVLTVSEKATAIGEFGRHLMASVIDDITADPTKLDIMAKASLAEKSMKIERDYLETTRRCVAQAQKNANSSPEFLLGKYCLDMFGSAVGIESFASVVFSSYDFVNRTWDDVRTDLENLGDVEGVKVLDLLHKKYGEYLNR